MADNNTNTSGSQSNTDGQSNIDASKTAAAPVTNAEKIESVASKFYGKGEEKETLEQDQKADDGNISATKPEDAKADEGKTDDKKPDDAKKDDAKPDANAAPEEYKFELPDEANAPKEVIAELGTISKELNLSQENAQKLATLGTKLAAAQKDKFLEQAATQVKTWKTEAYADKEIGGTKYAENLGVASKALSAFGTPALDAMLGDYNAKTNPTGTGLGSHPEIIRAFYRAGQALSEDNKLVIGSPGSTNKTHASVLYDKTKK